MEFCFLVFVLLTVDSIVSVELFYTVANPEHGGGVVNSLKPEFAIVIFIRYKPRIAVAILDL